MDLCPIQGQSITLIRLLPRKPGISTCIVRLRGSMKDVLLQSMFCSRNQVDPLAKLKQKTEKNLTTLCICFYIRVYKSNTFKQIDRFSFCLVPPFIKMMLRAL